MSYTKYLFIPIEKPIPLDQLNILINQLYEALASPVSTVDTCHAGFDRTLSIRITYKKDGEEPDYEDWAATIEDIEREEYDDE